MPASLISLCGPGRYFRVQYGDFVTVVPGELRNVDRLRYAILVTAGASIDRTESIRNPFCEGAVYPDEAVWYTQSRLPANGANCAALLAAGFCWTGEAASAAKEYRISATALEEIREAIEKLHCDRKDLLARLFAADPEERRTAEESVAALEERAQGTVNWQVLAGEEYEIPPDCVVASAGGTPPDPSAFKVS